MPSTAISAQGSTLQIDNTTPGTPDVAIANLISFSGLDGEATEIDRTNMSSTAKEKLIGLQDFGNFTFEMDPDYTDTGQNTLRSAQGSGSTKAFLLTLPNGVTLAFSGFVRNASSITGGVDAKLGGNVAISIDGAVTVTTP